MVVVSELLPPKPKAMETILQCNFCYVAELWKITNMERPANVQYTKWSNVRAIAVGLINPVPARFYDTACDWCKSRKQEGKGHLCNICQAPIWQVPNSLLPDDSMQIRASVLLELELIFHWLLNNFMAWIKRGVKFILTSLLVPCP